MVIDKVFRSSKKWRAVEAIIVNASINALTKNMDRSIRSEVPIASNLLYFNKLVQAIGIVNFISLAGYQLIVDDTLAPRDKSWQETVLGSLSALELINKIRKFSSKEEPFEMHEQRMSQMAVKLY